MIVLLSIVALIFILLIIFEFRKIAANFQKSENMHKVYGTPKLYLAVPFSEKDEAKELGAKWDSDEKLWFVPENLEVSLFHRWLDRKFLSLELVPKTCWFSNIRTIVSKEEWDKLRKPIFKKAGNRCEICGGRGPKWPLECHEIWHYNDNTQVQTLKGLLALCPDCHAVKHFGFALKNGGGEKTIEHLAKVNCWSLEETTEYINRQFEIWYQRSQHPWKLDVNWLTQFGIQVAAKKF